MSQAAFFIWISGFAGQPEPQKIHDKNGSRPFLDAAISKRLLAEHSLSRDQSSLSLAELAAVFPAPAATEGAR